MNYRLFLICILLISSYHGAFAQVNAINQYGQKVILYDDFTWRYAEGGHHDFDTNPATNLIEVNPDGMVRVNLNINGHRISFYNGKVYTVGNESMEFEYYQNSFFDKIVGKIKQVVFNNVTISFEYYQNSIFKKSEGKIKSISFGNETINFEYFENSFYVKSEGKVQKISKGRDAVEFEFYQNSIFPETEGKLKALSGNIPGIQVRYME